MYRVGLPFWKAAARLGAPLKVMVCVHHDEEANVYYAHSPDLRGLVVEARTLDDLWSEVRTGIDGLLEEELPDVVRRHTPVTDLRIDGALCAA